MSASPIYDNDLHSTLSSRLSGRSRCPALASVYIQSKRAGWHFDCPKAIFRRQDWDFLRRVREFVQRAFPLGVTL